jgi:hypothetical protein
MMPIRQKRNKESRPLCDGFCTFSFAEPYPNRHFLPTLPRQTTERNKDEGTTDDTDEHG